MKINWNQVELWAGSTLAVLTMLVVIGFILAFIVGLVATIAGWRLSP